MMLQINTHVRPHTSQLVVELELPASVQSAAEVDLFLDPVENALVVRCQGTTTHVPISRTVETDTARQVSAKFSKRRNLLVVDVPLVGDDLTEPGHFL